MSIPRRKRVIAIPRRTHTPDRREKFRAHRAKKLTKAERRARARTTPGKEFVATLGVHPLPAINREIDRRQREGRISAATYWEEADAA